MFGNVPEEFFGLIGRVTMVAALLEDRLVVLLTQLTASSQDKYAGLMAGQALPKIHAELRLRARTEFMATGIGLTTRLHSTFDRRNELVHSLWPNPSLDVAFGHRGVPTSKRINPGDFSVAVNTDGSTITALITDMVKLYTEVTQFEALAQRPENATTKMA